MSTSKPSPTDMDQLCINTIRTLAMDAVQQANSGHPGSPMGMAPMAYVLWQQFLRFDPADPIWPNRDRFVLSAGHASMLLYSLLHLTGVKAVNRDYEVPGEPSVTLDDIKRFRQLDSKCPGHPEYRWTSGVETTTGPLGQGVATSVGMAIAGRWLAKPSTARVSRCSISDVYAVAGDGCMMEGISGEAASLAGHLRLSNLCWIYDNNHITIEGNTSLAFSEDVATRFSGYGWNVTRVGDANDLAMLERAYEIRSEHDRPADADHRRQPHRLRRAAKSRTRSEAHGEPLGEDEIRRPSGFTVGPRMPNSSCPDGVYEHYQNGIGKRGSDARDAWMAQFAKYKAKYPEQADQLYEMQLRQLPSGWDKNLPSFPADAKGIASRDSSAKVQNAIAQNVPWLIGGSADLAPSTKTLLTFEGAGDSQRAEPRRPEHALRHPRALDGRRS